MKIKRVLEKGKRKIEIKGIEITLICLFAVEKAQEKLQVLIIIKCFKNRMDEPELLIKDIINSNKHYEKFFLYPSCSSHPILRHGLQSTG